MEILALFVVLVDPLLLFTFGYKTGGTHRGKTHNGLPQTSNDYHVSSVRIKIIIDNFIDTANERHRQ